MRVWVNRARCKGYGLCLGSCPNVFDLDESGKAFVVDAYVERVPEELAASARSAALHCPERAIEVEDVEVR